MKKNRKLYIVSLLALVALASFATDKEQDGGLWMTVAVAPKPFDGKWKTQFTLEYRSKNDFKNTSLFCGKANLDYVFNQFFQLGAGYELFLYPAEGEVNSYLQHRFYPEFIASYRYGNFSGSFRSRVMNTFRDWSDPLWETRNRFKVSYRIQQTAIQPFVGLEPFHQLYPNGVKFSKTRYTVGSSFGFGNQTVDLYFMKEDFYTRPLARNLLMIDYRYAF
jgi:hypothetical protein